MNKASTVPEFLNGGLNCKTNQKRGEGTGMMQFVLQEREGPLDVDSCDFSHQKVAA